MTTQETTETREETPKPKMEDSPEFKEALQKAIRQGTSKYQRQTAEANKTVKAVQTQMQAIQDELAEAKEAAEIARLAGDDVDEAARVKRILERERNAEKVLQKAEARMATATEYEKRMTMQTLHVEYGIPLADLEDLETAPEMEIAALKYERDQRKSPGKPAPKAEREEEEGESKPVDTAEGRLGSTKIPSPGTKEFEEFYGKVKANFSR